MDVNNPENANSSRIVRSNWLMFSWNRISRANKAVLVMSLLLVMIQIAATVIVLAIGNSNKIETPSCGEPLELYLIIYVVRVGLTFPLIIYQHLSRTPRRQIAGEQPSNLMSGWAYRLKSLLDLFAILWFIVGNYLVFSPSDCSSSASLYYYTILVWVILGYALLLVPVVICISIIFCLPVVLVAMRAFNINVSTLAEGGTKEDLAKIPIFRYKSSEEEESPEPSASSSSEGDVKLKRKPSFTRKWMKDHQSTSKDEDSKIDNLTISRSEDAVCSICLSEYENDDLLCKLW
ncbi:unnamed protein product [Rhizopus stolonifer]